MDFEVIFEKLGRFNYKNRAMVVMGTFAIFIVFSLGLINMKLETDPQELWVSHDSEGYKQEMNFNDNFGAFFRTEQIIMAQVGLFQIRTTAPRKTSSTMSTSPASTSCSP